jgi:hypothetical protein
VGAGNYDAFSNSGEVYWSSSDDSSSGAYGAYFNSDIEIMYFAYYNRKSSTGRVRAVIAF